MEIFKVSGVQFGWIFALIAAGLIGASQLNNLALKRYSSEQVIRFASGSQSIIGIVFVCLTLFAYSNLFLTVFLIFIFLVCQGFIFPNATALALAPLGHVAGSASALIGAIQMTIGASASAIVGILQNHSSLPMAAVMTCCAMSAFSIYKLGGKYLLPIVDLKTLHQQDLEMATDL